MNLNTTPSRPPMTDQQRELEIEAWKETLCAAKNRHARTAAWRRMQELIKGRSPEQVRRMERARGLVH